MTKRHDYEDIPGTFVFDAEGSRRLFNMKSSATVARSRQRTSKWASRFKRYLPARRFSALSGSCAHQERPTIAATSGPVSR
jgi:hypothetical protein